MIFVFVNVRGRPPKWKSGGDMLWGYREFLSCLVDSSRDVEGILSGDVGKTFRIAESSLFPKSEWPPKRSQRGLTIFV